MPSLLSFLLSFWYNGQTKPTEGVTMDTQPVRLEVITPLLTFFQH